MQIYQTITLDNGDILLQKMLVSPTINLKCICYQIINKLNGDILLQKIIITNISDISTIKNYNFINSKIISCMIDKKYHTVKLKYKSILNTIYHRINDGVQIIKNSQLNIKTIKKEDNGFYYMDGIGISVQGAESNRIILEIINQCMVNGIRIWMKIMLNNDALICIDF